MNRTAGRWLTGIGLAFALVMIAGGTTSLISVWWLRSEDITQTYAATPSLRVYSGCGNVTVEGSDRTDIQLTGKVWWSFTKPEVEATVVDGVQVVQVSCDSTSFGVGNTAHVTLLVPTTTAVTVRTSGGQVTARAITGAVDLHSDGGGIEASQLGSSTAKASSSAGSVRLSFAAAPTSVTAASSAGRVDVLLPTGSEAYHVVATSSASSADVKVKTDPSSPRTIDASSSAGSVLVDYVG